MVVNKPTEDLEITVKDEVTGEPIEDAKVELKGGDKVVAEGTPMKTERLSSRMYP